MVENSMSFVATEGITIPFTKLNCLTLIVDDDNVLAFEDANFDVAMLQVPDLPTLNIMPLPHGLCDLETNYLHRFIVVSFKGFPLFSPLFVYSLIF